MSEETKNRIAVLPGSFDPFTVGHKQIVSEASEIFDKVVVAVMVNESKAYMFSPEERCDIARESVKDIPNAEVIYDGGMLFELFERLDANAIVKGIRNETDLLYELEMAKFNIEHNPKARTVFIRTKEELSDVSSTAFRNAVKNGADWRRYICPECLSTVERIIQSK